MNFQTWVEKNSENSVSYLFDRACSSLEKSLHQKYLTNKNPLACAPSPGRFFTTANRDKIRQFVWASFLYLSCKKERQFTIISDFLPSPSSSASLGTVVKYFEKKDSSFPDIMNTLATELIHASTHDAAAFSCLLHDSTHLKNFTCSSICLSENLPTLDENNLICISKTFLEHLHQYMDSVCDKRIDPLLIELLETIQDGLLIDSDANAVKASNILLQLLPVAIFLGIHQGANVRRKSSTSFPHNTQSKGIQQIISFLTLAAKDCWYLFDPSASAATDTLVKYQERFMELEHINPRQKVLHKFSVQAEKPEQDPWTVSYITDKTEPLFLPDYICTPTTEPFRNDSVLFFSQILDFCSVYFSLKTTNWTDNYQQFYPNRALNWVVFDKITGLLSLIDQETFGEEFPTSVDLVAPIRGTHTSSWLRNIDSKYPYFSSKEYLAVSEIQAILYSLTFLPAISEPVRSPFTKDEHTAKDDYPSIVRTCRTRYPKRPIPGPSSYSFY